MADPLAQGLRSADAQLLRHRADRWPVRGVLRPHLGDHPDRTLTQLRRVVARSTSHGSIFLSRSGASGNSGAVQTAPGLGDCSPAVRGFRATAATAHFCWTKTETARLRNSPATIMDGAFTLVRGGGQGRGRTADLPLSGALSRFETKNANISSALLIGITAGQQPLRPS